MCRKGTLIRMYAIDILDLAVIISILAISALAWKENSLSASGAVSAFVVTAIIYLTGGITFLAPLLIFFISSTIATKIKKYEKTELEKNLYEKGGRRDYVQVLANSGAALILAAVYYRSPGHQSAVAFFTAFAACNADTWASEIGVMSRSQPFSVLTFKPVQKGISGGVSFLGLFASGCGAILIAGVYFVFMLLKLSFLELIINCVIISVSGFMGAIIDSVLGMLVQPAYKDSFTGKLTEKRFHGKLRNHKVKGLGFFSNDMVNFVSSLLAAGIAYSIMILL